MPQILRLLGLITGVGPLITALRTRWEAFDAYGTVAARESATLRLPGPISMAFESPTGRRAASPPTSAPSPI